MYSKFAGRFKTLKQFYYTKLDKEFKSDCKVWLQFLKQDNLMRVSRPFLDWSKELVATDINFTTDATAVKELGFGCTFQKSWTYAQWEKNFIRDNEPSIEFLELYALCMGIFTWQKSLSNKTILVYCDNEALVHMVNNTASSCPYCMTLIRSLTLKCLNMNTRVFARHLAGMDNILPDRLSRLDEFGD